MLDDRAQPVTILRSVFEPWPIKDDARIAALVRRLGVAIRGEHRWRRLALLIPAAVLSVTLIVLVLGIGRRVSGLPLWVGPLGTMVVMVSMSLWATRKSRQWSEPRIVLVILKEGLCPGCGYNLHGLEAAADACVVCPECGAAWKRERIWRTAPFDAKAAMLPARPAITGQNRQPAWTTRDATGMSVELAPARLRAARRAATPERAAVFKTAWSGVARASRWIRWPVLGLMWSGAAAILVSLATRDAVDWTGFTIAAIFLSIVCVGAACTNFLYSPRAMRRIMLRHALCPGCAATLEPMATDEARCACPGCLTEWPRPDAVTSSPPRPPSAP